MIIQKLPWAGIRVTAGNTSIVIDPLYNLAGYLGQAHEELVAFDRFGPVDAVLITHHHGDHYDPRAIAQFYGHDTPVYMFVDSIAAAGDTILTDVRGVSFGQTVEIGSIQATASYAVDGVGDPQVSWVIESEGLRVLHSGDSLWHGYWWKMKKAFGVFDAVCLPVNAPLVEFPHLVPPSGQPIVMSPEQAFSAARVLEAKQFVPIHYKAIHNPPLYRESPDVIARLHKCAEEHGIDLALLQTGEQLILSAREAVIEGEAP